MSFAQHKTFPSASTTRSATDSNLEALTEKSETNSEASSLLPKRSQSASTIARLFSADRTSHAFHTIMASVSRSMSLFSFLIHILYPLTIIATCTVPSDFWCDHPTVTNQCASAQYCQNYKNNVYGRKINLTLYFETHCPDSQLFIVDRLYPRVINDSNMSKLVNMDFCPWGMAIRMDSKVCCKHKRDRTCEGNKLISCAMQYLTDRKLQMNYIYCFEGYVLLHLPIEYARDTCYKETGVVDSLQQMIRVCTDGNEDEDLLKRMQKNTESIFPKRHSLVPWIELNGRSLPEIQVYQLFLAEKLKIWANNNAGPHTQTSTATASKCRTPPDFWCDDDFITNECFDKGKCNAYRANTLGRPIKITVILSSHCKNSQQFVVDVLFSKVWQNKELRPLVSIHLLPW
uniref:Uncharacterized protein n=1 Tax=Plectus sambesii TaxID=2011161 RepID=A0A914WNQ4_9BILA